MVRFFSIYFNSGPVSFNVNKSIFVTFQMKCVLYYIIFINFIILLFMDMELYTYYVGDIFKQIDLKKEPKMVMKLRKSLNFYYKKLTLFCLLSCSVPFFKLKDSVLRSLEGAILRVSLSSSSTNKVWCFSFENISCSFLITQITESKMLRN